MKNETKRWLASVLAVVIVGGMCYLSFDYRLTASEGDGSSTAVEQQQAVEEAAKPVEVIVPAKPAAEAPAPEKPAEKEAEKPVEKVAEKPAEKAAEQPAAETQAPKAETLEISKETEAAIPEETAAPAETEIPAPTAAPIVSEAPVETKAPAKSEAPAETQTPAETEAPAQEIRVKVRLNNREQLYFGDTAELEAIVDGAEVYTVRWQYNDGRGWKDIAGKTGDKYRFTLDEENAEYEYRALVVGA